MSTAKHKGCIQIWEVDQISPEERMNRIAELLARGVSRIHAEEKQRKIADENTITAEDKINAESP